MLIKGQLWATSDLNLVNDALSKGFKAIYLGDSLSLQNTPYKDTFITASPFVPDYQALSMHIDGNEDGFIQMYIASLNSKPAMEMMAVVLAALYNGVNIMFYMPSDSLSLNYIQYLLQFIEMNYGIKTQTKTTTFEFNPQFASKIIELLYLNGLVQPQEFLINTENLDNLTIQKLLSDIHPMINDLTNTDEIVRWFSHYKDELLSSGKPLINGIQYAGEVSDYKCY